MRTFIKLHSFICFIVCFNFSFSQYSDVQIIVVWDDDSYENKLEVYNTSNDLIATICDDNQCYVSSQQGSTDDYGSKYNLGCVANGTNYYIKLYDIANDGWNTSNYVSVTVAGTEVINKMVVQQIPQDMIFILMFQVEMPIVVHSQIQMEIV